MTIPHSNEGLEMTEEEIKIMIASYPVFIYIFPLIVHYYYEEWVYSAFFAAEIIMFVISCLVTKRPNKYQTFPATIITLLTGFWFRTDVTYQTLWMIMGFHLLMQYMLDKKDNIKLIHLFVIPLNIMIRFKSNPIIWDSFTKGLFWGYVLYWLYERRHYLNNYYIFLKQIK